MSIINFYDKIDKKYLPPKVSYNNEEKVNISLPVRGLLIGSSGVGKTNFLLNLIANIGAFNRIYLFVKDPEEPLYKFLIDHFQKIEKKVKDQIVFYSNDPTEILTYEDFDPKYNNLVVFDDLINSKSKDLERCANLYTMGRKRNVSCLFLSQSFFKIPLIIRQNSDVVFILRVNTVRDLHRILGEYQLDATRDEIEQMYKIATKKKGDCLLIDVATTNPNLRYRHNFTGFDRGHIEDEE